MSKYFNLYYHPLYTSGISKNSTFPRDRYKLLYDELKPYTINGDIKYKNANIINKSLLSKVHDEDYINRFLHNKLDEKEIRRIGLQPWDSNIIERTLRILGGSLSAMKDVILNGGFAGNMAGGTHHAHKRFGSGFCIFNDIAICAKVALDDLGIKNILIVDLDVHQGDGTAEIFKNEKRVFTFSMHCYANFPFEKGTSDLDISLPKETGNDIYLNKLFETINYLEKIPSEIILFQSGVDVLYDDRYGNLKLTRDGLKKRNKMIFEFAKKRNNPVCIFMGGGYSKPLDNTIKAFKDLFIMASEYHKNILYNNG